MKKYLFVLLFLPLFANASYRFTDFQARLPIHIRSFGVSPMGLDPDAVRRAYNLPNSGGVGTIAIIGAGDNPTIEKDLNVFSRQFGLPICTKKNKCFEKYRMSKNSKKDSGWAIESALDVEWAHAIAPKAKILLVEAKTQSGPNLLAAIDYAAKRKDVVAVAMSFGGPEFVDETSFDNHFTSSSGVTFFAASGDNGSEINWPAVSPNVTAVGGTTLVLKNGKFSKELAWSGSGGGVSLYESQPDYQKQFKIKRAGGMRAIPDVSFNADPASGVSVYFSGKGDVQASNAGAKNWYVLGGTSAAAPAWAGIKALGGSADNSKFYADKIGRNAKKFFRDIKSGSNGDCGWFCDAHARYDYITGLGSPLTVEF